MAPQLWPGSPFISRHRRGVIPSPCTNLHAVHRKYSIAACSGSVSLGRPEPDQALSLTARTAAATIWIVGAKFVAKGIDFCSLLILARLLGPEQFGLVAMAMTAVLVVEAVLELPLSTALLRVREPTREMYDTAFTLGLLRGILVALLLFGAAWGMARFYQEPQLVALICTLSIAPVMRGLISPQMVRFVRVFDFRREFVLEVAGKLCAFVVGVGVAWKTGSYWALALGTVTTPTIMMIGSQIMAPQRPRLCLREWPVFADIVGWNTLTQIFTVICWQADRIVLGRFVSASMLGRYGIASDLANLPMQAVAQQIMRPLDSAFVSIDDEARTRQAYHKASSTLLFALAPILLCMSLFSGSVISALLGAKWQEASGLLAWLAPIVIFSLITLPSGPLAMVKRRMRLNTVRVMCEAVIKLPVMLWLVMQIGVPGAVVAQAVGVSVGSVIALFNVRTLIGTPVLTQMGQIFLTLLPLLPTIAVALALDALLTPAQLYLWPSLILKSGLTLLFYMLAAWGIYRLRGRPERGESWLLHRLEQLGRRLLARGH